MSITRVEAALRRQIAKLGAQNVLPSQAELVIANGHIEESAIRGRALIDSTSAAEIVFCVSQSHEPHARSTELFAGKSVRRLKKPITPSLLREVLFSDRADLDYPSVKLRSSFVSPDTSSPDGEGAKVVRCGEARAESQVRFESSPSATNTTQDAEGAARCPVVAGLYSAWKPKNVPAEDAIACLSLGNYINSRLLSTPSRTPSLVSSDASPSVTSRPETPTVGNSIVSAQGRESRVFQRYAGTNHNA